MNKLRNTHGKAPRPWWQSAVFYQIYPRSFQDSNGDGVGDLRGIHNRLDYLEALGVDALWISPFFKSPMKDFGYDIADYTAIDPLFGTMDDFKELLAAAHARDIRMVVDLVVNHSSDEHPWFKEACSSRDNPKHDWYIWRPMLGRRKPNNWISLFEQRSAWYPNPATGEWYLGTFTRNQPEFNWRNAELRKAVYGVARFWLDLGVDGFRMDVATAYIKDEEFRSNPFKWKLVPDLMQEHIYDRNRPEVLEIFKEFRALAEEYPGDRVLIGETHGQDPALAAAAHGEAGDGLHMAFNFEFLSSPWSAAEFYRRALRWYEALPSGAWPNFTLSNHDQRRHYWRYRAGPYSEPRARVAAALLLLLRGTPFLYYGEELGMSCVTLPRKALRDPLGLATWPLQGLGRDPERTPMQWDDGPNAGFSSAEPWLPVNPDYEEKNASAAEADASSLLSWYKSLLKLRRAEPALALGELIWLDAPKGCLAWERELEGRRLAVYLNFRRKAAAISTPGGTILLGSAQRQGRSAQAVDERARPGERILESYEVLVLALG
ncbi:MAG TPA: glucohydrolase [Spirochaetaceae bacterium]|jgi:alpha-glucosidase|nr:glucohydrolase [Spirochaetaceae bacterium]